MGELEKITNDKGSEELAEKGKAGLGLGTAGAILLGVGSAVAAGCVLSGSSSEAPLVVRHHGELVYTSVEFNKGQQVYDFGDHTLKVIDSLVKQGYVSEENYTAMLYLLEKAQALKFSSNREVQSLANNIIGAFDLLARAVQEGEKYDVVIGIAYTDPFSNSRKIKEVILKAAALEKVKSLSQDITQKLTKAVRERVKLSDKLTEEDLKGLSPEQKSVLEEVASLETNAGIIGTLMDAGMGRAYLDATLLYELIKACKPDEPLVGMLERNEDGLTDACGGSFITIEPSNNVPLTDQQLRGLAKSRRLLAKYSSEPASGDEAPPTVVRFNGEVIYTSRRYNEGEKYNDPGGRTLRVVDSMIKHGRIDKADYIEMIGLATEARNLLSNPDQRVQELAKYILFELRPFSRKYSPQYEAAVKITYTDTLDKARQRKTREIVLEGATLAEISNSSQAIAKRLVDEIRKKAGLPGGPLTDLEDEVYEGLSLPQHNALVEIALVETSAGVVRELMARGYGKTSVRPEIAAGLAMEYGPDPDKKFVAKFAAPPDLFRLSCAGDSIAIRPSDSTPLTDAQTEKLVKSREKIVPYSASE